MLLLHKPAGVITTARDPEGRPTVVSLVKHPARVVPVGRLDGDTTGVLLLTNDGELANRLAHPKYEVEKVYVAELRRAGERRDASRGWRTEWCSTMARPHPHECAGLGRTKVELTIHEGRNRQVRRMFEAVGHRVRASAPKPIRPADARRARARRVARGSSPPR